MVELARQISLSFTFPVIISQPILMTAPSGVPRPFGYILKPFEEELHLPRLRSRFINASNGKLKSAEQWLDTILSIGDAVIATNNAKG